MSCPKCIEGSVLPGDPTGSIQPDFQGAYLASAPANSESTGAKNFSIVLLTDGFGLPLKNCKIIADKLASNLECDVWVPDYFAGRPPVDLNNLTAPQRADQKMTALDWLRMIIKSIPTIPAVFASRPSVVDRRLAVFFQTLKEKKKYEQIGAVGYCYGGSTGIRLASTDFINAAVICHPGSMKFDIDEIRRMKVPTSWACAEVDLFFPDSLRLQFEAEFESRRGTDRFVDYEFKVYPATAHGFAARPNTEYADIMEAHEAAFQQTVAWFRKALSA
ncbi:dienelactone hydrolase endo-1,3,1,4-beta-D-glucanase [Coprinopsis marcescibilis]|uniref:Dienelactone hydrolase endo-1,3,1,4-beta-D-glucanase n=1 Tax=Coprinopsis marcescibilis TaxID=230819 RepID=A0A5C3KRW6_COPMA|nr:dienelactone hydrolase endo-1,3,1,4-beta-D-glucanase [Coprinopsis marcescibilis]